MQLVTHLLADGGGIYAPPTIDTGDTAWLLASSALVLIMTPGLAFFYGGMVRSKNVLGMLMQNYFAMGIVSLLWVLFTFSLAFDKGSGLVGGLHFAGLAHMFSNTTSDAGVVTASVGIPGYGNDPTTTGTAQTIPPLVFVAFQLMFAIITPALIVGSTADRWKFGAFVPFIALWSIIVYAPVAHWVFSPEGWLFKRGAEDYAGGTVVHANAGAAGLAMCLVLGKRIGWPRQAMKPHNVPFILLGAALLWFGWFGFNAGSALGAAGAAIPFITTNTATATALLAWIGVEKIRDGHATTLGAASGAVAGLVAITPAAGYVSPMGSIAIGLIAGGACCLCTPIKFKVGFDDSLDVVAVHLVGGVLGALSIGLFGDSHFGGANGLFRGGGFAQLGKQAEAVVAVVTYSFVVSALLGTIINFVIKNRLPEEEELAGMDISLHGETAYEMGSATGGTRTLPGSGASTPATAGIGAPVVGKVDA